jgi:hypothetical protein
VLARARRYLADISRCWRARHGQFDRTINLTNEKTSFFNILRRNSTVKRRTLRRLRNVACPANRSDALLCCLLRRVYTERDTRVRFDRINAIFTRFHAMGFRPVSPALGDFKSPGRPVATSNFRRVPDQKSGRGGHRVNPALPQARQGKKNSDSPERSLCKCGRGSPLPPKALGVGDFSF